MCVYKFIIGVYFMLDNVRLSDDSFPDGQLSGGSGYILNWVESIGGVYVYTCM